MRKSRRVRIAAGAMLIAAPTSAAALAAGQADAQGGLQIDVNASHVTYGSPVRVDGSAPASAAGQSVELQYARAGATSWQSLTSTKIGSDGHFRFSAPLRRTGLLRAVTTAVPAPAPGTDSARIAPVPVTSGGGAPLSSPAQTVAVKSKLRVRPHATDVLGGNAFTVRGTLLPGVAGREVRLEDREHGAWHAIRSARTGARGGFSVRYTPSAAAGDSDGRRLRVRFAGDRLNTGVANQAGRFVVFTESLASWYDDGGNTACGFHAGLGVANKSLPCGTKVTFRYGGNTVTATVDDRGPYVGGREWDLNQSTAQALGFGGVGTVWSTS
jgi:hypothetical protein